MDQSKLAFIEMEFIPLLKRLPADAIGKWGKMNAQQMVEHVAGFFKVSTNQLHFPLVTPAEHLPQYKAFLLSDKPFRENTKAPVLPDEPLSLEFENMHLAIDDLTQQIQFFVNQFNAGTITISQHPVFGNLNFDEWVLLHYKHLVHHTKQFGLM